MDTEMVPGRSDEQVCLAIAERNSVTSRIIDWLVPDLLRTRKIIEEFLKTPVIEKVNARIKNDGVSELPVDAKLVFLSDLAGFGRAEEFGITLYMASCVHQWDGERIADKIFGLAPRAAKRTERHDFLVTFDKAVGKLGDMIGLPVRDLQVQIKHLSRTLASSRKLDTRQVASVQQTKALANLCWTVRQRLLLDTENGFEALSWPRIFAFVGALIDHCNLGPRLKLDDESIRGRFRRATSEKAEDDEMMEILKARHIRKLKITRESTGNVCSGLFHRFNGTTGVSHRVSDEVMAQEILERMS